MPRLTAFAREHGVVVERSIANSPSSLPTHASIFTGLYPPNHGAHKPFADDPAPPSYTYRLGEDFPTLSELLGEAGYWTVGLSANYGPLFGYGLDRGFDFYVAHEDVREPAKVLSSWLTEVSNPRLHGILSMLDSIPPFKQVELFSGLPSRRARSITDQAIEVVNAAGRSPYFLFLNYIDPHSPYSSPPGHRDAFPGRVTEMSHRGLSDDVVDAVMRGERDLSEREYEHLRSLYDSKLLYLDGELGRLLDRLRDSPDWDETLIIITADHGEALGEHRLLEHTVGLYDEMVWVPLIIKAGKSADEDPNNRGFWRLPFQSVDIFPTVLEHAGIDVPAGVDGLPWGRGRTASYAWCYVQQVFVKRKNERFIRELQSVERGRWKLIQSSTGTLELFDLEADPDELTNLASQLPQQVEMLVSSFPEIERRALERGSERDSDTEAQLERLRALGYVE